MLTTELGNVGLTCG